QTWPNYLYGVRRRSSPTIAPSTNILSKQLLRESIASEPFFSYSIRFPFVILHVVETRWNFAASAKRRTKEHCTSRRKGKTELPT
ncbi:uncharacterized protein MYCFIDRAFT_211397, partial [Pseudocercospora fijiensis CIRAD86]